MTALVWDASAAVKLVIDEPGSARARATLRESPRNYALDWTALEVASALWKRAVRTGTTEQDALLALDTFRQLDLEIHDAEQLTPPALLLAVRHGHPVYDCAYVALALAEDAAIVTADARLRSLAESLGIDVVSLEAGR